MARVELLEVVGVMVEVKRRKALIKKEHAVEHKRGRRKKKEGENGEEESMEVDEKPSQEEMDVSPESALQDMVMHILNFLHSVNNALLQHSAICSKGDICQEAGCLQMKLVYTHQMDCRSPVCPICAELKSSVDKTHQKNCHMPNCFVPFCTQIKQEQMMRDVPPCPPQENVDSLSMSGLSDTIPHSPQEQNVAGTFKYKDPKVFSGDQFREGKHYGIMGVVGNGTYGVVKKILVANAALTEQGNQLKYLVKKTNYKVTMREILIMQILAQDKRSFVYCVGVTHDDGGGDCIFMQEEGQDLDKYMKESIGDQRFLQPGEAKYYLKLVAVGLQKMHGMQYRGEPYPIVHMDIKGKNLLLSKDGKLVKIADLDSANFLNEIIREKRWERAGTPVFVAPEVLMRQPYGTSCDIFSYGVLCLELTVGVPEDREAIHEKIEELRRLDPSLAQLAEDCTQVEPEKRPSALDILKYDVFHENQTPAEV